jgi:hypothetical protein
MGSRLVKAGRLSRRVAVAGVLLFACGTAVAASPPVKTVSLVCTYQLNGTYSQNLANGPASCNVAFTERASFEDAWSSAAARPLKLASGASGAFVAHELPIQGQDWTINGSGFPGSDCSGSAVAVHCSGHVELQRGAGTVRASFIVLVRGGRVLVAAATGSTGLDENGNDCLTGATWDGGAPTIYPALPDVTGPYMGVEASTRLAAIARLRKGATLKLAAKPASIPSGYSPSTCNHAADGATIASCSATFKVTATIRVTRVR